jgi:hypothetical protein
LEPKVNQAVSLSSGFYRLSKLSDCNAEVCLIFLPAPAIRQFVYLNPEPYSILFQPEQIKKFIVQIFIKGFSLKLAFAVFTFIIGAGSLSLWYFEHNLNKSNNEQLIEPVIKLNLGPIDLESLSDKVPPPPPVHSVFKRDIPCSDKIADLKKSDERLASTMTKWATKDEGFESLAGRNFPENSVAVRIWYGGGIIVPQVFGLERINNVWKAWEIESNYDQKRGKFRKTKKYLDPPGAGWEGLWTNLQNQEILSLPDASEVGDACCAEDANSVLIETSDHNQFRNYAYPSPRKSCLSEAQKISKIGNILFDEFGTVIF